MGEITDSCIVEFVENELFNDPTKIPYIRPEVRTSCGRKTYWFNWLAYMQSDDKHCPFCKKDIVYKEGVKKLIC